jgi:peptidoglycan/xylan/chitin deacetylase (PgdA/CDA1 family)
MREPSIGRITQLSALKLRGVPIFNYHGLAESFSQQVSETARRYWLSPAKFRAHLAHIRGEGFHPALLDELTEHASDSTLRLPTVVLTFDDGLTSDYEIAFPLLAEFGMKAAFFLNTATIGQSGYLDWTQITEMQRHGMSFQSHSHHHVDLTVLPTPALDAELTESKLRLEDGLGRRVDFLSAPHGMLDRRVVRRALALRYHAVCSTRCWPAIRGSRVFTRITLHRDVQIEEFHGFLAGNLWLYAGRLSRGLVHGPVRVAEHLLGVLRHRWFKLPAAVSK